MMEPAASLPATDPRPGATAVLRAPQVSRVLSASLVGRLPLGAAPLALLLFAREGMTLSLAGVLVGAYTAGLAMGQPVLARIADRWRQPPVMWGGLAASTAGFVLVALAGARPVVALAGAAAAGLGAPPFEACLRVLWTDLVGERLRHAAYTLDVTIQELIFIVGPLLALALVWLAGPAGGLVAIAAVQASGTLVFATAPAPRRWRGAKVPHHWAGPLRSGPMWILLATTLLVGFGVGSTVVAVTAYAEAAGSRSWAGWLLAAQAAGALAGGLVTARHPPGAPCRRLPHAVLLLGVLYLPMLLTSPLPLMAIWVTMSGLTLPAVLTGVFVTADRVAPRGTTAEAFAWVATAFLVGSAAGSAVNGTVLDATGVLAAGFGPAPVAILIAAALPWLLPRPEPFTPGSTGHPVQETN